MNIELSRFSEEQLKSWREEIAVFIQENEKLQVLHLSGCIAFVLTASKG